MSKKFLDVLFHLVESFFAFFMLKYTSSFFWRLSILLLVLDIFHLSLGICLVLREIDSQPKHSSRLAFLSPTTSYLTHFLPISRFTLSSAIQSMRGSELESLKYLWNFKKTRIADCGRVRIWTNHKFLIVIAILKFNKTFFL